MTLPVPHRAPRTKVVTQACADLSNVLEQPKPLRVPDPYLRATMAL
jgi:hypothetical protein